MLMRFIRAGLPVLAVVALAVVGVSAGSAHGLARGAKVAPGPRARLARQRVARDGVLRAPRSAFVRVRRGKTLRAGSSGASTPITSCGVTLTVPGTYTLANNVDGSGDTYCIDIAASGVTVDLNGHKITDAAGNATYGVLVEGSMTSISDDQVYGGAISNYEYGVYLDATIRASLSKLRIVLTSAGKYGVYETYAADSLSKGLQIHVGSTGGIGWYGQYGSDNTVTNSFLKYTSGTPTLVETEYEYQDTFSDNTAACRLAHGGPTYDCGGYGYADYYSNRDAFSGDKSYGNAYGFYLYGDEYGTVTATDNVATDYNSGTAYGSYGFYNYYNYYYDYGQNTHQRSTYSDNTVEGFQYGFLDYYGLGSVYKSNMVVYASLYGYYLEYPARYSITDNTSIGTNSSASPDNSAAYGFYLYDAYSYYALRAFNDNQSNDNYYGFYSNAAAVHGTGNTAQGDEYDTYNVETGG